MTAGTVHANASRLHDVETVPPDLHPGLIPAVLTELKTRASGYDFFKQRYGLDWCI